MESYKTLESELAKLNVKGELSSMSLRLHVTRVACRSPFLDDMIVL